MALHSTERIAVLLVKCSKLKYGYSSNQFTVIVLLQCSVHSIIPTVIDPIFRSATNWSHIATHLLLVLAGATSS